MARDNIRRRSPAPTARDTEPGDVVRNRPDTAGERVEREERGNGVPLASRKPALAAGAAPSRRRRSDEAAGTLVLIGGAASAAGAPFGRFLDLTGAREGGGIVGFTTASGDPVASAMAWRADFASAGARNIEIPIVDQRARAQDRAIAAMVREARGIFLGGGDQVHLIATLSGTRVGDAIRESHAAGAIVCGTSAGAAALTETTLAHGEVDETGNLVEMYIGPGLGLLGFKTMIDTHFGERRRLHRLFVAIAGYPEIMGLGIDEDTALVVNGHLGEVVGRGSVTFVDGRGVRYDNADEVKRLGAKLTLSYLRVGIVGAGHTLNLRERELEVLVQAKASGEPCPVVKGDGVKR
jgi:cyanophycinase